MVALGLLGEMSRWDCDRRSLMALFAEQAAVVSKTLRVEERANSRPYRQRRPEEFQPGKSVMGL